MSPNDTNEPRQVGILARLNQVSSAEEFFTLLSVEYDERVLNVARLHILRRMAQYLAREPLEGLDDATVAERCQSVLARAYADFVASSPIEQRVFKVLKDAVAPAPAKASVFVPLKTLN